jgi:hypothetical protein
VRRSTVEWAMADSADELILKMQHLQAQAKASLESGRLRAGLERVKSAAQKLAAREQVEVASLEKVQADAEGEMDKLSQGGVHPGQEPAFVAARHHAEEAKKQLVRARAQLNFALDRVSEVERREFEAFQAEVRAQIHADVVDDPQFNKGG